MYLLICYILTHTIVIVQKLSVAKSTRHLQSGAQIHRYFLLAKYEYAVSTIAIDISVISIATMLAEPFRTKLRMIVIKPVIIIVYPPKRWLFFHASSLLILHCAKTKEVVHFSFRYNIANNYKYDTECKCQKAKHINFWST